MVESGGKHRTVEAGRGTAWWTQSWALFVKNPGMWLVFGVIFFVGFAVLGFIPVIGGLVAAVLSQVILGGWMLAARKLDTGGTLEVGDLFSGFKEKLNPLLTLGAVAVGASIVTFLVMAVMGGGAVMGMMLGGASRSAGGLMASAALGMIAMLVGLALAFVFAMAFWFAPALVVFRDTPAIDALKASWSATLANFVPFLVYSVIWLVAAIVASIPFALGWLVLTPLTVLGIYCAYKDIFEGMVSLETPGLSE
ncbi:BPSS1780 family membrane protein [Ramlibacter sp.]|uniref:BPSS1780 family membrane protein n=1 Tax=Ramlibacter sp. TaxID=1917967 RepID=UPI002D805C54|nr:BPSS1780 family membrane protein [Ramlibacter sp.]